MTLPTGAISLSQVNTELSISPSSTTINMGATAVRTLAGQPSGAIAMSDLQGKSNAQFVAASGGSIATSGDFKIHTFTSSSNFVVSNGGNSAGPAVRLYCGQAEEGAVERSEEHVRQHRHQVEQSGVGAEESGLY